MALKPLVKALLFAALSVFSVLSAHAQDPPLLAPDQPIEREIKGGETHSFKVKLGSGQTARVEIVQKGVDVSLAGVNPAGERYIETESPSGLHGEDLILLIASADGEYTVLVTPADPRAASGKYIIRLSGIVPATAQHNEINSAAKKILEAAEESNKLRRDGTREGRRKAIEKFREIISLSKIKQDRNWEAVALISSGYIYEQLGELQNALDLYTQGLAAARETKNRQYEGTALNNLGANCLTVGDYEKAIFFLEQAIRLQREAGNKNGEGSNLNNFGTAYLLLGDLDQAEKYYTMSLAIRREIKDRRGQGFALNNLGQVFYKRGELVKAADNLQQALDLRRSMADRQGEAMTLKNLGTVARAGGDNLKAGEYFLTANKLAAEIGDRRMTAETFYWLALGEKERANFVRAIEYITAGLALTEQIRGELFSMDQRTSYFSTVQQYYELYVELLGARYEISKEPADVALALQISERARTRSLTDLLQEARINIDNGADPKLPEQMRSLQDSINLKYRQLNPLSAGSGSGSGQGPDKIKLTAELTALNREMEDLRARVRRENPRYAGLTEGTAISAAAIRELIDEDTLLLEYKLGQTRSFLWLVSKQSIEMYKLPGRAEIETAALRFYDSIVARDKEKTPVQTDLPGKLGDMLLGPVAGKIGNKRLAIVADGVLQFTPFSALMPGKTLIANEIVVLPSANVLAELRRGTGRKLPSKTVAVFADAVFESTDSRLSKARITTSKPEDLGITRSDLRGVLRNFTGGENLPRLLSSRVEARDILKLVPKDQGISNMDFDASRENASSETLADYRILHFATHGLLDTKHPEFSGLVFSLFDRDSRPRDGFLRLNQVYNLNLNSDLVVLSACQTALGKDVRGEGLIGLTRGFMYAGAKRVVASLWKVDDSATAEFMKRFYQNLLQKKLPPAAALRQAQAELRQIPRFRPAYFWAGFTLQGDWR